ncbi:gamma-butyrobetaine hydroxylase family protein [Sessilibacter sp. MAH2]
MDAPEKIKLHKQSQTLELAYNGINYQLSAEFLRVHSPSAEVRGHGQGQETLQHGKINVAMTNIEACGNYALKIIFNDGHDSGLYSWDYLKTLCENQFKLWRDYLDKLDAAGLTRDPNVQVLKLS